MVDEVNIEDLVPYHPGVSTTAEAQKDYKPIHSDHQPFRTKINELTLISWNVLESDGGNGFAYKDADNQRFVHYYGEKDPQADARHDQIAVALRKMCDNHQPEVVLLQEIEVREGQYLLFAKIQEALGNEYVAVTETYQGFNDEGQPVQSQRIAARGGNIAFYRKGTFASATLEKGKVSGMGGADGLDEIITGYENVLTTLDGRVIRVRNVHSAAFSHLPLEHEKVITAYLNEGLKNGVAHIVIGDFNCPVSKLPGTPNELVTSSVAPPYFTAHDSPIQQGHYIDGAFFTDLATNEIRQADTIQLDPKTGLPFDPISIAEMPKNIPAIQLEVFKRFRPAISVDACYKAVPFADINSHSAPLTAGQITSVDNYLNKTFNSTVRVRYATDLFNNPGMSAFGFTANEFNMLKDWFPDAEFQYSTHVDYREPSHKTYIVSIPAGTLNTLKFVKALNAIELIRNLPKIKGNDQAPEMHDAISELIQAVVNDDSISFNQSTAVYQHFLEPVDALAKARPLDTEKMQASEQNLHSTLNRVVNMKKATKAAIWGAIGVVIGFAVGFVVGTLITAGAASVPVACLGAAIGGAIFGAEISVAGAIVGAGIGCQQAADLTPEYKAAYNKASSVVGNWAQMFKLVNAPQLHEEERPLLGNDNPKLQ